MTEAGWTSEKPSKEGVYWFRWTENSNPLILSVAKDDCDWRVLEMGNQYDGALAGYSGGEFLGPITPDSYQQGRVAGVQDVLESFKKHHDACNDFRHCECAGGFWYEHIGKAWMDEKAAQAAQDEKGVGDVHG